MDDKQNHGPDEDESSPAPANGSEGDNRAEAPRSYYYDDATGYEIYKEEDGADEDVDEQEA